MTSPDDILAMVERLTPPFARIGTVTTGGATPEVSVDGAGLVTVQHLAQGLTLSANDRVLLVRAAGSLWVAVTKVTTPTTAVSPVTQAFAPTRVWWKGAPLAGAWNYQYEYVTDGAVPQIVQGQDYGQGGGGVSTPKPPVKYATVLYWGSLTSLLPASSTILSVSLAFTRDSPIFNQPALTYPKVYGHAYTDVSPPTIASGPVAVGGFGPLAGVAAIGAGQSTTIGLPASWVTAWAANTIRGLTLYSDQRTDVIYSNALPGDIQLIVTYQPPAGP